METTWDVGDTSESGLFAVEGSEDEGFTLLEAFSAMVGWELVERDFISNCMPVLVRPRREASRGYVAVACIEVGGVGGEILARGWWKLG